MQNDVSDIAEGVRDLDACATVGILTRLYDPDVCIFLLLELLVGATEPLELGVAIMRCLDIECEGNGNLKRIDTHCPIVSADV